MVDEVAFRHALTEYARTTVGRYGLADMLYRLTDQCVDVLGCGGAGVSIADPMGSLRFVTATDERIVPIEEKQVRNQAGPCYEAFSTFKPVVVDDLLDVSHRWPDYCRVALDHGCQAVIGLPMGVHDTPIGALNVYRRRPHAWSEIELETAQVLADMAAGYIANLRNLRTSRRLTAQLEEALQSRAAIEQAKGIIATRRDVEMECAFEILRTHARQRRRRLHDVARDVTEGELDL